jgi:hypothetical protein
MLSVFCTFSALLGGRPLERQGELLLPLAWEPAGENVDPAALVELFVSSAHLGGGEAESQADAFDVVGRLRCSLCLLVPGGLPRLRVDEIGRNSAQDGVLIALSQTLFYASA